MRPPWVFEGFAVGSCRMILILAPITHNEVVRSDLQWVEGGVSVSHFEKKVV